MADWGEMFFAKLYHSKVFQKIRMYDTCFFGTLESRIRFQRLVYLFFFQLREPGLMYGEHAAVSLDDSNKPDENKVNDWNANVYSQHFVDKDEETQQAVQKMNQNTKKVNDWDANVYSYHFVDQDQQTEEAVKNMNKNAKLETSGNDWNANVYSYHFVDQDPKTEEAVKYMDKNAKLEANANDWNANVYSYHFVDKDEETEQAVLKMKDDIGKVDSKV